MTTPDPLLQGRFTQAQLFERFFSRPTWWLRDNLCRFDGEPQALVAALVQALPKQDSLPKRTYLGMSLMWLGRAEGNAAVRATLQGDDDTARLYVLDELRRYPRLQLDAQRRIDGTMLSFDDIAVDLAPLLADPERVGAQFARELCITHAFAAARPALAALRLHPQWPIARQVLDAYRMHELDEGTLGLFERWLGEPGIRTTQADRERLHGLCRLLSEWATGSRHPEWPKSLALIALRTLQQAMDAHDRSARLQAGGRGWLEVEALLGAVAAHRPEGSAWLLQRMAALAQLHPLLRAHALVHYQAIAAKPHTHVAEILSALWALPREERIDGTLPALLGAGGLLTAAALGEGLKNPLWTGLLLDQRQHWPALDAAQTAALLLDALQSCAAMVPPPEYAIEALLRALDASAEPSARVRAVAILRRAVAGLDRQQQRQLELGHMLAAWQLRLGDGEGVDLDLLPPWQAMRLHWQRCLFDWNAIACVLADAGMIEQPAASTLDALPPITTLASADDEDNTPDRDPLLDLFERCGRPLHEVHLVDNGYEHHHDQLFAALTAQLRPPLAVDCVQQHGAMRFDVVNSDAATLADGADSPFAALRGVPVVSTEGSALQVGFRLDGVDHRFTVYPQGTWMDDGSVVGELNSLLALRGHPERIRSLHHWASWGYECALYVCVPATGFDAVAERLRLPLREPAQHTPAAARLLVLGGDAAEPASASYLYDWTLRYRVAAS